MVAFCEFPSKGRSKEDLSAHLSRSREALINIFGEERLRGVEGRGEAKQQKQKEGDDFKNLSLYCISFFFLYTIVGNTYLFLSFSHLFCGLFYVIVLLSFLLVCSPGSFFFVWLKCAPYKNGRILSKLSQPCRLSEITLRFRKQFFFKLNYAPARVVRHCNQENCTSATNKRFLTKL